MNYANEQQPIQQPIYQQPIPENAGPIPQPTYAQPQQPIQQHIQQPVQQPVSLPESTNVATFTADTKVLEYIQMVHPEMASAMINIAIKKFARGSDFTDFFLMDQFKDKFEAEVETLEPESTKTNTAAATPAASTGMDFTAW